MHLPRPIKYFISISLCLAVIILIPGLIPATAASPTQVKELNFVFLHGRGSTSADLQLLADTLEEQAQPYISAFIQANPGTDVKINFLQRSYPNDVSIETWANSIADSIEKHFAGKKNLILIGHSMGGKAALYGVAHNTKNLGDLTSLVVTINSPIKDMNSFYVVGGASVTDYVSEVRIISNKGVAESIASYDSSADGLKVTANKHWLALTSAESAPSNPQFDTLGVDPFPKDMDDGAVPLSAQYSAGADAVYYGEWGHGDFTYQPEAAGTIADQILRYLFGGTLQTSVLAYNEIFEHHAGWLPITYQWDERFGESPGASGIISHTNTSFFGNQQWEDIVSGCSPGSRPAAYRVQLSSIPVISAVNDIQWLNPGDPADCRLSIKTRASPKAQVQVRWNILQYQPLPPGTARDHYEIRAIGGTTLTGIPQASWPNQDQTDPRVQIVSEAEGPFRWLKAEVKVYYRQAVKRKLIDEILPQPLTGSN